MSFARQHELFNDSKYRSFSNAVEKVLKNFEYSSEWADLISALGKLNKVLQANAKYGAIPKTITVGKRLSQCMHPALPSGVHLKAIDVYDTIFKILGPDNVKLLLSVFSSGLFSLYANASTPVRPVLLKLFEAHLLPLGHGLTLFIDGLLLGILPGLEEGSEHFDRVNTMLITMSDCVGLNVFYGSMWRCVLSSPSGSVVRLAAVQLILRQFDRGKSMDDQLFLIGNDVETMVQSLSETLRDINVLTQRSALDILLFCFPLSSLSISSSDIVTLFSSALFVVLRRDMSLNRRLYSWILGIDANKHPSASSVAESDSMNESSQTLLHEALNGLLVKQTTAFKMVTTASSLQMLMGSEIKLLRVLISLLDKSEIGPLIISDSIMVPTIKLIKSSVAAYTSLLAMPTEANPKVKSNMTSQTNIENVFQCVELCEITDMFLEILSLETYPEIQTSILPEFLQSVFTEMRLNCSGLPLSIISNILQMSLKVLQRIQPPQPKEDERKSTLTVKMENCSNAYLQFFTTFIANKIFNNRNTNEIYENIMKGNTDYLEKKKSIFDATEEAASALEQSQTFTIACKVLVEASCFPMFVRGDPVSHIQHWLKGSMQAFNQEDGLDDWLKHLLLVVMQGGAFSMKSNQTFSSLSISAIATILHLISITTRLKNTPGVDKPQHTMKNSTGIVSVLILPPLKPSQAEYIMGRTKFSLVGSTVLWKELDGYDTVSQQLAIASLFLKLYFNCIGDEVESYLLEEITSQEQNTQLDSVKRFCKLWRLMRILSQDFNSSQDSDKTLSRCLFVIIDQLKSPKTATDQPFASMATNHTIVMRAVSSWLRQCIEEGDICNILEPYFLLALNPRTHRKHYSSSTQSSAADSNSNHHTMFLKTLQAKNDVTGFSSLLHEMRRYCSQDEEVKTSDGLNIQEQIAEGKKSYTEILNLLSLQDNEAEEDVAEGNNDSSEDRTNSNSSAVDSAKPVLFGKSSSSQAESLQLLIYVYQEHFDTSQVLFSLQSILSVSCEHTDLFIFTACTTSMSSGSHLSLLLQDLMVRHERTLNSDMSFYEGSNLSAKSSLKNQMVIEILINICVYYLRSAFLNEKNQHYTMRNHEIQCTACLLLTNILRQLSSLLQTDRLLSTHRTARSATPMSTQQFSAYIMSVLESQQVQKTVIMCLIATLLAIKDSEAKDNDPNRNDVNHESCDCGTDMGVVTQWCGNNRELATALFSHLLELAFAIITLEHHTLSKAQEKAQNNEKKADTPEEGTEPYDDHPRICCQLLQSAQQYEPSEKLASQNVFISTLLEIYRLQSFPELHSECNTALVSVLSCLRTALPHMITPLLSQFCRNIEAACNARTDSPCHDNTFPPQYIENTIKTLCVVVHDCLLIAEISSQAQSKETSSAMNPANGSNFSPFGTIFGVFNQQKATKATRSDDYEINDHIIATRNAVLQQMVRIVSCMSIVWQTTRMSEQKQEQFSLVPNVDNNKTLVHNVVQMLGPLAIKYGENLLCALAVLWDMNAIKLTKDRSTNPVMDATDQQMKLLDLLAGVHGLSFEAFLNLVQKSMKSFKSQSKKELLEENILHVTLCYLKRQKSKTLLDSWPQIHSIIKEAVSFAANSNSGVIPLSPRCYYIFLHVLVEFVRIVNKFDSKKDQKDLQEVVEKCIEVCNTIAGSCLEQSNWTLRKNLSVMPGPQVTGANKIHKRTGSQSSIDLIGEPPSVEEIRPSASENNISMTKVAEVIPPATLDLPEPPKTFNTDVSNEQRFEHSVQALTVLSQVDGKIRQLCIASRGLKLQKAYQATASFMGAFYEYWVNLMCTKGSVIAIVANLLDIIYGNDERDRAVPVLTPIMSNILPYLRNHHRDNVPSFHACSVFMSSISGFQHTRRVWRKEILDLLLDAMFFKMPYSSISHWRIIVDHLMTHDKTTFKEFLSRISLARGGSATPMSIFSNKDQEAEQRAMQLKRLAFVVYSSGVDQYHRSLPDVQERLAECLRLYSSPVVLEKVFLCFRVLILRISPHNMTSLWPAMYTELTHAMLQLEQTLTVTEAENNKVIDGVTASWNAMYLSACKLLDLLLCLPSQYIPVFQLYRWCFVSTCENLDDRVNPIVNNVENETNDESHEEFIPYCVRIKELFNKANPDDIEKELLVKRGRPLLTIRKLKSLQQLQPFINTITSQSLLLKTQKTLPLINTNDKIGAISNDTEMEKTLEQIEKHLNKDFLEVLI